MRQQPQLDLAVVGVHENMAGRSDKHPPDLRAELAAHRDILQVRFGGRQTPRGGHRHLEIGMDAAVRLDDLQQSLGIGGFQLGQHPIVQHLIHDRMLAAQLFQHVGVGAPAGFGFFARGQHQFVKKHRAELLGRKNVELVPGVPPDALLQRGNQALSEVIERLAVNIEAGLLHLREHAAERHFDGLKELRHTEVPEFCAQRLIERPDRLRPAAFRARIADGNPLRRIVARGRVEQIGSQRRVEDEAVQTQPLFQQQAHQILYIVGNL